MADTVNAGAETISQICTQNTTSFFPLAHNGDMKVHRSGTRNGDRHFICTGLPGADLNADHDKFARGVALQRLSW